MKKTLLIGMIATGLTACQSTLPLAPYEVVAVKETPRASLERGGFFYSLPRQVVHIDFLIERKELIKGPYADFAEKMLGSKSPIKENKTIYSLEDVQMSLRSEADPKQVYFVKFGDEALRVQLGEGRLIQSLNCDYMATETIANKSSQVQWDRKKDPKYYGSITPINIYEQIDTLRPQTTNDSIRMENFELRTTKVEKSLEQKAEEALESIIKLREDRSKLLTGFHEVNYEAAAMEFMYQEFNRLESEYTQLFTGITRTTFETLHLSFCPQDPAGEEAVLGGFSESYGMVKGHLSSYPSEKLVLRIDPLRDAGDSLMQAFSNKQKSKDKGLFYAVPKRALVSIRLGNKELENKPFSFSQLGTTERLPVLPAAIRFDPTTGEILSLEKAEEVPQAPATK